MWSVTKSYKVKLGGNFYINCGSLIDYRGSPLFTLKRREPDGLLGIDFDIYCSEKRKVATIRRGTIVDGDRENYAITHNPYHYTVTERSSGRVVCDIRRASESPEADLELSVDMFTPSGFHLIARPDSTNIGGIMIRGNIMADCAVGIGVG